MRKGYLCFEEGGETVKNKKIERLVIILLVLLIIYMISQVGYIFKPLIDLLIMFVGPLIIGGFIYYWIRPVTRKMSQGKLAKHKGLVSIVAIILFFSIFVLIISSAGVKLTEQLDDTVKNFLSQDQKIVSNIELGLGKLDLNLDFFEKYIGQLKDGVKEILTNIPSLFSSISDITTQIVLIPFILYYLLKEEDNIARGIEKRIDQDVSQEYRTRIKNYLGELDGILSTYIVGQLLVALIIGALMFIGYLIIGFPNALLMASFSVVTAVIPFIGTFLGVMPPILIAFTLGIDMVIKIVVISVIVQQLEGNIISPNLMGSRLNIHPFIVMLAVIVSINLMGIFGAFIGVPLYLALSLSVKEIYKMKKLED